MIILIIIIAMLIYLALPWYLQLVAIAINTLLPDPIPFLDEIIMYSALLMKIYRAVTMVEWISEHPKLSAFIFIVLIAAVLFIICHFF